MEKIKKIRECPMCGADVSDIDPASLTENKCPYCDYELYNHAREIYDERIEDVKDAKARLIRVQLLIAAAAILVVVIGGIFVWNRMVYRQTDQYFEDQAKDITGVLRKAYEKEDWDKLYELVIEDFEKGMQSPYYYSYRAAWVLSYFVPGFDGGCAAEDADGMKQAYKQIKAEYLDRESLQKTNAQLKELGAEDAYLFVPEIEDALEKEYLRETQIMEERGLLN